MNFLFGIASFHEGGGHGCLVRIWDGMEWNSEMAKTKNLVLGPGGKVLSQSICCKKSD